jgi:hypothetical protein
MHKIVKEPDRAAVRSRLFLSEDALRRCRTFVLVIASFCVALAVLAIYFPPKSQTGSLLLMVVAVAYGYLGFIVWEVTYAHPGARRIFASLPIASQNIHLNHWLIKFLAPAIAVAATLGLALSVSALRGSPLKISDCALALFVSIALMGMNLATHSVATKSAIGKLVGIGPFILMILIIFRPGIRSAYLSAANIVLILAGIAYALFGIAYLRVSKGLAKDEVFISTWVRANEVPVSSPARSIGPLPHKSPSRLWRGAIGLVWCRFRLPFMLVAAFAGTAIVASTLARSIFDVEFKFEVLFPMTLVLMPLAWLLNLDWIKNIPLLKTLPLSRVSLATLLLLTSLAPSLALWAAQRVVLSVCTTEPYVEFAYALPMWAIQLLTMPVMLRHRSSSLLTGWGFILTLTFIALQIGALLLTVWTLRGRLPWFVESVFLAVLACAALWWTTHELSQTNRTVKSTRARENLPT